MPSVLFASHHFFPESGSGAMVAMRELLFFLRQRGWDCRVVCGGVMDSPVQTPQAAFAEQGMPVRSVPGEIRSLKYEIHRTELEGTPVVVYQPEKWTRPPMPEQGYPFLQLLDRAMTIRRPDVLLTFGGNWVGRAVKLIAARHGVPVVFWLRNTEYSNGELFNETTAIIVPSEFSANHFRQKLGISCEAIHSPLRLERVVAPRRNPKNLTFVCPNPQKGAFYFARIAAEIGRLRPDIPILAVVGRGNLKWFAETGMNLRLLPNFNVMAPTSDPRKFWSVTRVLLTPSLWLETFMRVAAEAMCNGIPVLASARGALPGTLGDSGFLFDIPAEYTPATRKVPSAEEVSPWVKTILRLWDDEAFYAVESARALAASKRFHPDEVIPMHEKVLFRAINEGLAQPTHFKPLATELEPLKPMFAQPPEFEGFRAIYSEIDEML
jgi:glycosyltransferase involved in cell wall biosynthesis